MSKLTSIFNKLYFSKEHAAHYTPEAQQQFFLEHRQSLGLGPEVKFADDAFDQLAENRITELADFGKIEGSGGVDLQKKLADTEGGKVVRDMFRKALASDTSFQTAKTKYAENIAKIHENMEKLPKEYTVQSLRHDLINSQQKARQAIVTQQKKEISQLQELFNKPLDTPSAPSSSFIGKLKQALDIQDDDKINKINSDLLAKLQESHNKQLAEFNKSAQESLTKLDRAQAKEMANFFLLANLNKDEEMRREIERAAKENRKKANQTPEATALSVHIKPDGIDVSSVKIEDLNFIKSLTGHKIEKRKSESGNPEWAVHLNFLDRKQVHKTDMLLIAQAVRASGADSITMKISGFGNPELSQKRARQAYEAAIESGFLPEKINLKIDGKLYTAKEIQSELYGQKTNEYAILHQKSIKIREELNNLVEVHSNNVSPKQRLNMIKAETAKDPVRVPEKGKNENEEESPSLGKKN